MIEFDTNFSILRLFVEHETGLRLLENASRGQLAGLDLPYKIEAVGLRRSFESFQHYARRIAFLGAMKVDD